MKVCFAAKKEMIVENEKENDCATMGDWLRIYNVADDVPFIEAFRKMSEQYYPDKRLIYAKTRSVYLVYQ